MEAWAIWLMATVYKNSVWRLYVNHISTLVVWYNGRLRATESSMFEDVEAASWNSWEHAASLQGAHVSQVFKPRNTLTGQSLDELAYMVLYSELHAPTLHFCSRNATSLLKTGCKSYECLQNKLSLSLSSIVDTNNKSSSFRIFILRLTRV